MEIKNLFFLKLFLIISINIKDKGIKIPKILREHVIEENNEKRIIFL